MLHTLRGRRRARVQALMQAKKPVQVRCVVSCGGDAGGDGAGNDAFPALSCGSSVHQQSCFKIHLITRTGCVNYGTVGFWVEDVK